MKTKKRVISFVLALVMVLATVMVPAVSAKAASGDKTLTIKDNTRTYEAYQIFEGTLDDKTLSDIEWGDGVDSSTLLDALKAASFTNLDFAACSTASDVAKVLGDNKDSLTENDKALFAKLVADKKTSKFGSGSQVGDNYTISGLADGYYLIVDVSTLAAEEDAYSRYLVDIPQTSVINDKREVPSLDKSIIEDSNLVKQNVAGVGEKVEYQLDSKVPDMTGYNKYYFVVEDTMSDGLTFNNDVNVTIGSTVLTPTAFVVTPVTAQKFKIVIKDFINYTTGDLIKINYSATLNEKAVVGTAVGNTNTVHLTYSNDPKANYAGENEPIGDDPVGVTPDKKVTTYTTQIVLKKTDEGGNPLAGAEFEISGPSEQTTMINEKVFEISGTGTYRRLKNGTYTNDTEVAEAMCADTNKYALVEHIVVDTKSKNVAKMAFVGDGADGTVKGQLIFNDLGAGTFTISETTTPEGYNSIDDFDITIEQTWNTDKTEVSYTVKKGDEVITEKDGKGSGIYELEVKNKKGIVLPSTGGMGTTLFYVVGGVLVAVAGVLLITKKRMEKQ